MYRLSTSTNLLCVFLERYSDVGLGLDWTLETRKKDDK